MSKNTSPELFGGMVQMLSDSFAVDLVEGNATARNVAEVSMHLRSMGCSEEDIVRANKFAGLLGFCRYVLLQQDIEDMTQAYGA